jgi:hypothetical protein
MEKDLNKKIKTMRKLGVLQWAFELNFWVAEDTCHSLYLYVVSVNGQVAWIVELQLIIYMMRFIVTLSKKIIFNHYVIPL